MVKFIKTPTNKCDNETIVVLIPIIVKQSYFYKLRCQKLWTPVICPHVYCTSKEQANYSTDSDSNYFVVLRFADVLDFIVSDQ